MINNKNNIKKKFSVFIIIIGVNKIRIKIELDMIVMNESRTPLTIFSE